MLPSVAYFHHMYFTFQIHWNSFHHKESPRAFADLIPVPHTIILCLLSLVRQQHLLIWLNSLFTFDHLSLFHDQRYKIFPLFQKYESCKVTLLTLFDHKYLVGDEYSIFIKPVCLSNFTSFRGPECTNTTVLVNWIRHELKHINYIMGMSMS